MAKIVYCGLTISSSRFSFSFVSRVILSVRKSRKKSISITTKYEERKKPAIPSLFASFSLPFYPNPKKPTQCALNYKSEQNIAVSRFPGAILRPGQTLNNEQGYNTDADVGRNVAVESAGGLSLKRASLDKRRISSAMSRSSAISQGAWTCQKAW